ncbi:phosphoglycolate phosphatase [Thermocatellispora tengchongensis]|uniref:Phosphoglycolate phosphatase n=1 Tax=Thermocatellispora tengchongensis TaxID=1073253 RepID=A0A840PIR9_9ACTN|nr:HAD hydrolase-like protein [Thermocatellispora tengchongensis]MBB5139022.1 phosphoglycolate phosphatase [Thermocatellispora tengchongensis]
MTPTDGPRPVGVLAFDWNGTLVDDAERARRATNRVLREHRVTALTKARFRKTFTLPVRCFLTAAGVPEPHAPAAERRWNEEMAAGDAPLSAGAADILQAAADRRVRVVVVSAAAPEAVLSDARRLRVDHLLPEVIGSVQDKAAELRRLVAENHGPVIYVGDVEYDMRCAIQAGAYPIGFGRGYRPAAALAEAGADMVVWNLATLRPFLSETPT